jgi:hypothetical protein
MMGSQKIEVGHPLKSKNATAEISGEFLFWQRQQQTGAVVKLTG